MIDTDIAWAAGFFDGEGSIGISPYSGSFRMYVGIDQNNPEPLEKLKTLFGGCLSKRTTRRTYSYSLRTKEAETFLTTVLPYLTVKRNSALIALEFRNLIGKRGKGKLDSETYAKMSHLRDKLHELHEND